MANTKVRLQIRVKLNSGPRAGKWVYCPIVRAKNKSIKLHWASVDGEEELHEEGVYTLLFRNAGKQRKEVVEAVQDLLATAVKEKKSELEAIANGHKTVAAEVKTEEKHAQRPLAVSVKTYLEKVKTLKGEKTYDTYSTAVQQFTMSCMDMDLKNAKVGVEAEEEFKAILANCKLSWDHVKDEAAILKFIRDLQDKGDNGDRTRANKVKNVRTLFLQNGIPWPLSGNDMPTYTEKLVKKYTEKEMKNLLGKSTREQWERHQFFVGCGGRDEEVQFAFYTDINFNNGEFNVKANEKTKPGFKIKGKQERSVPLPAFLVKVLWERRKRNPDSRYIFPALRGGRNLHFLRLLKKQSLKNDLNCGGCTSKNGESCTDHPVCEHWILHRFRKTFATMHYRSKKVTMKTLQKWLGHERLETTELYLADEINEDPEIRAAVDSTFEFLNETPPLLYL